MTKIKKGYVKTEKRLKFSDEDIRKNNKIKQYSFDDIWRAIKKIYDVNNDVGSISEYNNKLVIELRNMKGDD